jgi:tetratricopeptide (TPR) repeat protein
MHCPAQRSNVRLTAIVVALVAAFGLQIDAGSGVCFGPAPAQAQAEGVRPEVGKPLQQAAELMKANRAKDALAKVREAEAVPNRTPAEQLTIDRMRGAAAARAGETQTAIKSFEAALGAGRLGQAEQAQIAGQLAYLYSQLKDWNRTREWAQKARQMGGGTPELDKLLAFVNAQSGDFSAVARDAQASIDAAEKAGGRPSENDLLTLADAQRRTGNNAGQMATLEKLVAYYPKKDYWAAVLTRLPAKSGFSPRLSLDLMRLKRETRTLDSTEEVIEMAQMALQEFQAAEATAVLEEGFARGLLGKGAEGERHKRLLALATQRAADAPKALAEAESEAKDGTALVRIGFAYTGMGQHDKGIALMQKGIAKGDVRHPDEARLHLGIGYLRAGNKAKAAEAFRGVKGSDGTADLARLWLRV